jgi:hypothetical protein
MAFSDGDLAQIDRAAERREHIAEFLRHHPEFLTPVPALAVLPVLEPARLDAVLTADQAADMDDTMSVALA